MTRINLLPWRARRRQRRQRVFLVQAAATVTGVVALAMVAAAWCAGLVDHQRMRNQYLAGKVAELDARIDEIGRLRAERERMQQRLQLLARLGDDRYTLVRMLDGLAQTLVPGVYYTAVAKRGDTVAVQGAAESNDGIAALMRNLRDSFAAPNLKSIAEAGAGATAYGERATAFELTFEMTSAASSQLKEED